MATSRILTDTDAPFDVIVIQFIAYVAAFYGAMEFMDQYPSMRALRKRFKLDEVRSGTLALGLAAIVKLASIAVGD